MSPVFNQCAVEALRVELKRLKDLPTNPDTMAEIAAIEEQLSAKN